MSQFTSKKLYSSMFKEFYSHIKKVFNKNDNSTNTTIDRFSKYRKAWMVFFEEYKIMEDNKVCSDINDEDLFRFYGILCIFYIMEKGKDESILATFNIDQFSKNIFDIMKQYPNIDKYEKIYNDKFEAFKNKSTKKNTEIYREWFFILFERKLSSVKIIERKDETNNNKKRKKKKQK